MSGKNHINAVNQQPSRHPGVARIRKLKEFVDICCDKRKEKAARMELHIAEGVSKLIDMAYHNSTTYGNDGAVSISFRFDGSTYYYKGI